MNKIQLKLKKSIKSRLFIFSVRFEVVIQFFVNSIDFLCKNFKIEPIDKSIIYFILFNILIYNYKYIKFIYIINNIIDYKYKYIL